MNKYKCPISITDSYYCCDVALNERENYESCYNCSVKIIIEMAKFIENLKKQNRRKNGK